MLASPAEAHARPELLSRRAGCALVGLVTLSIVVWLQWPRQHGDPLFDASVARPAYTGRHPRLLFDEAHWNVHKTGRG